MKTQQGAVLIVALVMLVVISVISFTGINIPTIQEQLNVVAEDRELAFQCAEEGLRAAERKVQNLAQDSYRNGGECALRPVAGVQVASQCEALKKINSQCSAGRDSKFSYSGFLTALGAETHTNSSVVNEQKVYDVNTEKGAVELYKLEDQAFVFELRSEGYSPFGHKVVLKSLYVIK